MKQIDLINLEAKGIKYRGVKVLFQNDTFKTHILYWKEI